MIRPTLLLIDNCSAHEAGLEAIETTALRYTRVEFLPPNTEGYKRKDENH
jgi:hypothetical protein